MNPLIVFIILCSGPGAADAMRSSSNISLTTFVIMVSLCLLLLRYRTQIKKLLFAIPVALIVLHPYLWMNVFSGDCGYAMRYSSLAILAIYLVAWSLIFFKRQKS